MKPLLLCALLLCSSFSAWPCLNKSGTKYGGGTTSTKAYFGWVRLRGALKAKLEPTGVEMEASLRGSTNFNDRSDYAIALLYLGRTQEAIELLRRLEQERPGEYFVASNLGTAYELAGNNDEALRWIHEGLRRNPEAHEGTEWLHEKILEAKIAQQQDPAHFEKHSVLELQPGNIDGLITLGGRKLLPEDLAKAIQYQLVERLQFVKPPDAPVASLLFDYAAIEAATKSMESAKHILQMAIEYGYPAAKVRMVEIELDRRLGWAKAKQFGVYAALGIAVIAGLGILYKRGIFILSKKT